MAEKTPARTGAAKPRSAKTTTRNAATPAAAKAAPARRRTPGRMAPSGADLQALIRQRAYELWESDGRPEGRDELHWQQAEQEVGAVHDAR